MKRLALALILVAAGPATAEPSKEYRDSTTTRCVMARGGCRELKSIAVGRARSFCTAEGGVKVGAQQSDFRCEQRGINCVITGRIECNGRIDPRKPPMPSGFTSRTGESTTGRATRGPTCLDAECTSFVDYAPGHREQGMHACRDGYAMTGVGGATGDIVCRKLKARAIETRPDRSTVRFGMRTCPSGMLVRGLADDRSALLCTRYQADLGAEFVQKEELNHGLQVCEEMQGEPHYLTGIDGAREGIVCAPARSAQVDEGAGGGAAGTGGTDP